MLLDEDESGAELPLIGVEAGLALIFFNASYSRADLKPDVTLQM